MLMLSHGDNDHAGAYNDLLRQVTPSLIFSGEPDRTSNKHQPCYRDQQWQWDGVTFRVLSPEKNSAAKGNNASCVLLIESPHGRALLLGDAERSVEKRLATELPRFAPIDIVIAGHHGSASSSSTELINAVNAKEVWFSAGYLNRYRFPKAEVLNRWSNSDAMIYRTDCFGNVVHSFKTNGQTHSYWPSHKKLWHQSITDQCGWQ
jgi:competence protein ComEC